LVAGVADEHVVDVAVLIDLGDERAVLDGLRKAAVEKSRFGSEDRVDGERTGDLRVPEAEPNGGVGVHGEKSSRPCGI
jgi:hypothetical protein